MIGQVTNHVWQSTLFAIAAGLLTAAFRRNGAKVRYWLWFSASLKFLLPFSLLIGLGGRLHWAPAVPAARPMAMAPVSIAIARVSEPFTEAMPAVSAARESRPWGVMPILGVWGIGFAGVGLLRLRGWRRVRRALRASVASGIRAAVEVRCCPGLLEPGVAGWLRPVLLLPAGIAEYLTAAQLEAVLAHELCHVRRRDNVSAAIHMLVEAVFWFDPPVWWIGARLVEERERACDEEVLSLGGEPRVYAEGILNVCKFYVGSPLACVSGVTGSNIKKRIELIMTNRISFRLNFAKKAALAAAGITAVAAPIVIGMMHAPRVRAQAAPAGTPRFESVSIQSGCGQSGMENRKSGSGTRKTGSPAPPSLESLHLNCSTVAGMIHAAYGPFASGRPLEEGSPLHYLDAVPLSGGPAWIYTEQFQIEAKAPGNPGMEMMRGPMMQALLEDRFQVKVRRETRTVPGYVLRVADGGPKAPPFQGDCVADSVLPLAPGQKHCWEMGGERKQANFSPSFAPDSVVRSLDEFGLWLFVMTDRPVSNQTGLTGRFFLDMVFTPDQATPGALTRLAIMAKRNGGAPAVPSKPPGPSIFEALQQQLGLKLEVAPASRDFLIVDRAERPAGN